MKTPRIILIAALLTMALGPIGALLIYIMVALAYLAALGRGR